MRRIRMPLAHYSFASRRFLRSTIYFSHLLHFNNQQKFIDHLFYRSLQLQLNLLFHYYYYMLLLMLLFSLAAYDAKAK